MPKVVIGASRGRNPENPSNRASGIPTEQRLEINANGVSNTITTVLKDNYCIIDYTQDFGEKIQREYTETAPTLRSGKQG